MIDPSALQDPTQVSSAAISRTPSIGAVSLTSPPSVWRAVPAGTKSQVPCTSVPRR
jgi:hypothetical protein